MRAALLPPPTAAAVSLPEREVLRACAPRTPSLRRGRGLCGERRGRTGSGRGDRAGHHGRGHGHVAGALLAALAAALRRHADVQPAARLHRVAHHPGRPAGLRALHLLPHRLQQPGELGLRQRIPGQDIPRDSHLPLAGSLRLRPHPPSLRDHLPHLLHGWSLLHQQDLLHALPGCSPARRPRQGCRQRQEEELTSRGPSPGQPGLRAAQ